MVIRLSVLPFFCDTAGCPKKTFAEQVPGLTSRRARRTPPLAEALTGIALALAGRAGARLAALLGFRAGKNSLLPIVVPGPLGCFPGRRFPAPAATGLAASS